MACDMLISRCLEGKRRGHEASAVGERLVAYECEREPEQAERDAEALDALLANSAETARVERLIVASGSRLPAVLARTLRLQSLFAPWRILEMGAAARALLKGVASHVNSHYAASVRMPRRRLAELARTFEVVRKALLCGTASSLFAAKAAIRSNGFPAALFFDEESADRYLAAEVDDPYSCRLVPRELFAVMMLAGGLCREQKAKLFREVRPFGDIVEYASTKVKCCGFLFGEEAVFGDDIIGLSRPAKANVREESPDYPMAVNAWLQRAFADSEFIRRAYVANKMSGHDVIASSFRTFGLKSNAISQGQRIDRIVSLADDSNPAYFKLMLDIAGLRVDSVGAVLALLDAGHAKSLAYLVREHFDMLGGCLTPEQLLFHCATLDCWDDACELAEAVETAAPGTAAKAVDPFGNTPLWYVLYNGGRCDTEGLARYAALLKSLGCDPRRANHLGLSAEDIGI